MATRGLRTSLCILTVLAQSLAPIAECVRGGNSAISIARHFGGRQRNFTGEVFWARGYFVSTVGLDEEMVRAYIRNQELEDERYDQMKLGL